MTETAVVKGVSLYPEHWALISDHAQTLGMRGNRSRALQAILDDWERLRTENARLRSLAFPPPVAAYPLPAHLGADPFAQQHQHAADADAHPTPPAAPAIVDLSEGALEPFPAPTQRAAPLTVEDFQRAAEHGYGQAYEIIPNRYGGLLVASLAQVGDPDSDAPWWLHIARDAMGELYVALDQGNARRDERATTQLSALAWMLRDKAAAQPADTFEKLLASPAPCDGSCDADADPDPYAAVALEGGAA